MPRELLALLLALLLPLAYGCAGSEPPLAEPPDPLAVAERHFGEQRYGEAARLYSAWLEEHGAEPGADRVTFRLALIHLTEAGGVYDPAAALGLLGDLVRDFPESPYRPAVEELLAWHRDLVRLRGQLEELKRIDLRDPPDRR